MLTAENIYNGFSIIRYDNIITVDVRQNWGESGVEFKDWAVT